jgi:poly(3-hydroxybutyrate) depolymerase
MSVLPQIRLRRVAAAILWTVVVQQTAIALSAADVPKGFQERTFADKNGVHRYTVFVPARYTPDVKWPVILYLHGASARGTDNKMPMVGGLGAQVRARTESFPFLVVFPQSEELEGRILDGWEADSPDGLRALKILDAVERDFSVDRSREILTGWSMGGTGAWDLAATCPDRWAGVVIVAGKPDVQKAASLKNVRLWVFHGIRDHAVSVEESRKMVAAVRAAGGHPFFTELPEIGHNIGHVVYGSEAVYDWMQDPKGLPQPDSIVQGATRPPTNAEMGRDVEFPFVPGIDIADALYVRFSASLLDSVADTMPDLVPPGALSGVKPDVHETRRDFLKRFDIQVSGLSWRGQLEQVRMTTDREGCANLYFGLRNMIFEVAQTQVKGRFTSTVAGPMEIVIGEKSPVWLSVRVRPLTKDRHLRFEIKDTHFQIPDDNWYVTTPNAHPSGLPIVRNQVAATVVQDMVNKAYARKPEIESQIAGMVPALVEKCEGRIDAFFDTAKTVGTKLPVPTYLPRYKLWPSQVYIDESGIAMSLGITFSRPGVNTKPQPLRMIRKLVDLAGLPRAEGFQFGVGSAFFEGMTAAAANAQATAADVRDLGVRKFFVLCDRKTMTEIIPDLTRYGESLEVRTRFELIEPVTFDGAPDAAGIRNDLMKLTMRNLRAAVQIRTSPHQYHWTRCAEFDIKIDYLARLHVDKPTFERRLLVADTFSNPKAYVTARFAEGYQPLNPMLGAERVADIFASGWRDEGPTEFLHGALHTVKLPDFAIGPAGVRLADAAWCDPYLVCFYRQPHTRITNDGQQPLVYTVRGRQTEWSKPLTLDAGQSHEYAVPYPVTVKTGGANAQPRKVPLGVDFKLCPPAVATPVSTLAARPTTRDESRQ